MKFIKSLAISLLVCIGIGEFISNINNQALEKGKEQSNYKQGNQSTIQSKITNPPMKNLKHPSID